MVLPTRCPESASRHSVLDDHHQVDEVGVMLNIQLIEQRETHPTELGPDWRSWTVGAGNMADRTQRIIQRLCNIWRE